jgi:hypothetical protein
MAVLIGFEGSEPAPPPKTRPAVKEVALRDAPTFVNRIGPFELFKSTKTEVRRVLGETATTRAGEGECCGDELCYVEDETGLVVQFDFGPSTAFKRLSGYRFGGSLRMTIDRRHCGRTSKLRDVLNQSPIRLGDSAEKVQLLLGLRRTVGDGRHRFIYTREVPFTDAEKEEFVRAGKVPPDIESWTLTYWIEVLVKAGVVEEVEVGRTEMA